MPLWGVFFLVWCVVAAALVTALPLGGVTFTVFWLLSVVTTGGLYAIYRKYHRLLLDGPHPLSPAAEGWQEPTPDELQAAGERWRMLELLAYAELVGGAVLGCVLHFNLIVVGGGALLDSTLFSIASTIQPATPAAWGPAVIAALLLAAAGFFDVKTDTASDEAEAAIWKRRRTRTLFIFTAVLAVTVFLWKGWHEELGVLVPGAFALWLYIRIVRRTW